MLPNRIHIKITEHQPIAILDLGRKFMINTAGKIFKELSSADADDLPVISGLEFSDLHDSEYTRTNPLQAVMAVLLLGQKKECILPNQLINRIHVDREIGLTVYAFDKSKAIKLGYNQYPAKLDSLKNILFHLRGRHEFADFESIDLNNLNRIVVNPVRIKSPQEDQKEV
jgi:cell division protein FtsQ